MDPCGNCKIKGVLFHKENKMHFLCFFGRSLRKNKSHECQFLFSGSYRFSISSLNILCNSSMKSFSPGVSFSEEF